MLSFCGLYRNKFKNWYFMKYQCDSGPQIKVDFYINNGVISKINLSNSAKLGTSWEIISDLKSSNLEKSISTWMEEYCNGNPPKVELPINLESLSPFTKKVLDHLYTVPFGETMSYMELALSIHKPKAARAVGNACGRNPLPLLIPCHRILARSQHLGGFSGGLSIKKKLLQHEGITFT